jgi:hypothetical protein
MPAPTLPHLEQLLGQALGRPVAVAALERLGPWAVARATLRGAPWPSVIVKWLRDGTADPRVDARQIATERAALEFLAERGFAAAPTLIAADAETLVLEDLSPRRQLSEQLVARGLPGCRAALLAWARTLGELGASTWGEADRYAARRAAYGEADPAAAERGLGPHWQPVSARLAGLGLEQTSAEARALAEIERALHQAEDAALTNGDVQANNFLVADDGAGGRLIDYEAAAFRPPCASAVLIHAPGPASITVSDPFNLELEAAYRTALAAGVPAASDDAWFGRELAAATLAYACDRLTRFPLLDTRPAGDGSRLQMLATLEAAAGVARRWRQWAPAAGWTERAAAWLRHRWLETDIDLAAIVPYAPRG